MRLHHARQAGIAISRELACRLAPSRQRAGTLQQHAACPWQRSNAPPAAWSKPCCC